MKLQIVCITSMLAPTVIRTSDWSDVLTSKKNHLTEAAYHLLHAQQTAFAAGSAPKIAEPAVKSIPIKESSERLVSIHELNNPRLRMLPAPAKPGESPDCNSGYDAACKIRATVAAKLEKTVEQLDALADAFGYTAGFIDITVFEALRDIKVQEMLFENKKKEILAANPELSEEAAFEETCKWVSPVRNNVPVHTTGGAVDVRLWNNHKNEFVDMGPFGVIWGKNPTAPTYSQELTAEQKNNRYYLLAAAAQAGLVNYTYEWWHFSHGDRYAQFWQESDAGKRVALYDAVSCARQYLHLN